MGLRAVTLDVYSALFDIVSGLEAAVGATAAGLTTVWVNRAGDAVVNERFAPAHQVPDLRGLLPLVRRAADGGTVGNAGDG